jgi:rod shape-determining protein MreC
LITLDARDGTSGLIGSTKGVARDVYSPVQSGVDWALDPVRNAVRGVRSQGQLEEENARLREQLEAARGDALEAQNAQRELRALYDLYNIRYLPDVPRVTSRVIASTSSNFELTLSIDTGENDGIAVGMPVVTGSGLIGRVVETSQSRSTVALITDPSSAIGVRVGTTGDIGVAKGTGPGQPMNVDLLDTELPIVVGEVMITSGLQSGAYPAGIPVGTIRDTDTPAGQLTRSVTIDPVVDLSRLDFVQVLQWTATP